MHRRVPTCHVTQRDRRAISGCPNFRDRGAKRGPTGTQGVAFPYWVFPEEGPRGPKGWLFLIGLDVLSKPQGLGNEFCAVKNFGTTQFSIQTYLQMRHQLPSPSISKCVTNSHPPLYPNALPTPIPLYLQMRHQLPSRRPSFSKAIGVIPKDPFINLAK